MKSLIKSLPIVARAMGENYGVQVTIGGNGAWTNGKIINLPVLPEDDKMAEIYARGFLDHEAGHVRFTDIELNQGDTPLEGWMANAIEDIRIEKEMGKKFPGCKLNLERLAQEVALEGGFSPDPNAPASTLAGFFILTQARHDVLRQKALKSFAADNERQLREILPEKTVNRLKGLVYRADSLSSTQDSLDLARQIIKEIGEEIDNLDQAPPEPEQSESEQDKDEEADQKDQAESQEDSSNQSPCSEEEQSGAGQSDGDQNDSDQGGNSQQGSQADDGKQQSPAAEDGSEGGQSGSGQSDGGQDDSKQGGDSPQGGQGESDKQEQLPSSGAGDSHADPNAAKEALRSILEAKGEDLPQNIGEILKEKLSSAAAEDCEWRNPESIRIPSESRADSHKGIAPRMEEVKRETSALRSRLAGLVQASRLQRSFPKRTGSRVAEKVLTRIAVGDDRIYQSQWEKTAVNTAVIILMDRSGSMSGVQMEVAKRAVLASASALEVIPGIAVSTAAFPGRDSDVAPLTRFGQKVKAQDYGIAASGGTPLAPALWWAASAILARPEPRKIVLVATDGEPSNPAAVLAAAKRMSAEGIELLGLGICTQAVERYFDSHSCINDIRELPKALFGMLQSKIIGKAA